MKLKSNSLFMLDAADYNYPYTEYLVEKIAKKKKYFFLLEHHLELNQNSVKRKIFFI